MWGSPGHIAAITKHGLSKTGTYSSWKAMKARCLNPKNDRYADYGGRGIKVCAEWLKFEGFFKDMGERPAGMTIDREDVNGNYEPGNCRWISNAQQQRSRRDNVFLTFNGKTLCHRDWEIEIGLTPFGLRRRLDSGWSVEQALTTPSAKSAYNNRKRESLI